MTLRGVGRRRRGLALQLLLSGICLRACRPALARTLLVLEAPRAALPDARAFARLEGHLRALGAGEARAGEVAVVEAVPRDADGRARLEVGVQHDAAVWVSLGASWCPGAEAGGALLGPDEFCACEGREELRLVERPGNGTGSSILVSAVKLASRGGAGSALLRSAPGACPRGSLYGAYHVLERLGFDFLRPLSAERVSRGALSALVASRGSSLSSSPASASSRCWSPQWPVRSTHYHTQHSVELARALNGWGPGSGELDFGSRAEWEAWLPVSDRLFEWLAATRQTRFEFALLRGDSWAAFADSAERQARLRALSERAHSFCLGFGIEASIAFVQQHARPMVRRTMHNGSAAEQAAEIRASVDWLVAAGADIVGTESGYSEFSHPNCSDMLRWMETAAAHAWDAHRVPLLIKAHCSSGQTCGEFGGLNFNMLPERAGPRVGVAPHTVQFYELDDPAPGVYGQANFSFMKEWMWRMAGEGKGRSVVFYGETEYWVDFDSSVPLFLPLYARARFNDLRTIARHAAAGGADVDGQMNFDSGFEWGYWLNSHVAAAASYDARLEIADDDEAFEALLRDEVASKILARPRAQAAFSQALAALCLAMHRTMVAAARGRDGHGPPMHNRTAISYITGYDTYADLGSRSARTSVATTRVAMQDVARSEPARAFFRLEALPPLLALERAINGTTAALRRLRPAARSPRALLLLQELVDALHVTALRTLQVRSLYAALAAPALDEAAAELRQARAALDAAQLVVDRRQRAYALPQEQLNAWARGPTSYKFQYLWTVKTLFFWWRDEAVARALLKDPHAQISPCFRNIENPLDEFTQFEGSSTVNRLTELLVDGLRGVPLLHAITDCINAPRKEPGPYRPPEDDLDAVLLAGTTAQAIT
jgi:hypothetical protein